jgi:hypothetical protein
VSFLRQMQSIASSANVGAAIYFGLNFPNAKGRCIRNGSNFHSVYYALLTYNFGLFDANCQTCFTISSRCSDIVLRDGGGDAFQEIGIDSIDI